MKYELQNCVASRLRRLSRITDGYLRKVFTDFDITENQMNILFLLHSTGKIEQGIIGKKLILERSTISRGIRLLEKKEYISRSNEYRPEVELTQKGKKFVDKALPIWETFMDEIYDKLGETGMTELNNLEKKLM